MVATLAAIHPLFNTDCSTNSTLTRPVTTLNNMMACDIYISFFIQLIEKHFNTGMWYIQSLALGWKYVYGQKSCNTFLSWIRIIQCLKILNDFKVSFFIQLIERHFNPSINLILKAIFRYTHNRFVWTGKELQYTHSQFNKSASEKTGRNMGHVNIDMTWLNQSMWK